MKEDHGWERAGGGGGESYGDEKEKKEGVNKRTKRGRRKRR